MAVVIHWVGVAVYTVYSTAVIDKTITVIIHAVVVTIRVVAPHVQSKILVGVVNSGIYDRDHNVLTSGRDVPGFNRFDIGAGEPTVLAGIVKMPLGWK